MGSEPACKDVERSVGNRRDVALLSSATPGDFATSTETANLRKENIGTFTSAFPDQVVELVYAEKASNKLL